MNCQVKNSLVVGSTTSLIGTLMYIIFKSSNTEFDLNFLKDIIKKSIMFFIVGILVHFLLEYFNFNALCDDKQCFGNICRLNK